MPWDNGLVVGSPAHNIASDARERIRVMAGPGTGKSFSMRRRVARLLEQGVIPERILAVTFTRIAAEDIRRELHSLDVAGAAEIEARTLHSLAMKILRQQHVMDALGRTTRPMLEFEVEPLLYDLDARFGDKRLRAKRIAAYEAGFAREQIDEPVVEIDPLDTQFRIELVSHLEFSKSMLLGELIPYLYIYLRDNPAAAEFEMYSHILVDEYQDLNKIEQGVIRLLSRDAGLIIVGDEHQSIYSFKHAHREGILEWEAENLDRGDHQLLDCHRCPETVVSMANSLIANNQGGANHQLRALPEKGVGSVSIIQFLGTDEEANGIAADIVQRIESGTAPGDILVLTPRKILGMKIANRLREAAIPHREYLSESELETDEVTERLALLMVACDHDDRPALRWLLGFGSDNYRAPQYARLKAVCQETGLAPWDTLGEIDAGRIRLPHTRGLLDRFRTIRAKIGELAQIQGSAQRLDFLFPADEFVFDRIRDLFGEELEAGEGEIQLRELKDLIVEKIYEPNFPADVDYVRIMTLYGSKGLGCPVVYITSVVDGLLPRFLDPEDNALERGRKTEEQRRLFYVALTRVKALPNEGKPGTLTISSFRQFSYKEAFNLNNGNVNAMASRFLRELGAMAPAPQRR